MANRNARIQAWLADLNAINADIDINGLPAPRPAARRRRKLKPLWEE